MFRQIALVAASALILAGCGVAPSGMATGMAANNGSLDALRRVTPKKSEFEHFTVNSIQKARDGGTIVVKGYINRSTYLTLRFDHGLSSKTKGQIFVTVSNFGGDAGDERAVTAAEATALAKAIRSNMSRAGADLDVKLLEQAADQLDQAAEAADANPFAGLEIVSIDSQPVRCPCFTLVAKAGDTTVKIDFEGFTNDLTVTRVEVGVRAASDTQRAALRSALEKAASKLKDKDLATRVKQVAKAL